MAAAAKDPSEKADFLEVERGWLSLALRYGGRARLPRSASFNRRLMTSDGTLVVPRL